MILAGLIIGTILVGIAWLFAWHLTFEPINDPLSDWSDGDCGVLPRDYETVHSITVKSGRLHDHE